MGRRARARRHGDGASGFAWMLFGLGLGLLVAVAVYFSGSRLGDRFARERNVADVPVPRRTESASSREPPLAAGFVDRREGLAEPSDGGAAAANGEDDFESRFDFYELLPRSEVVVPEAGLEDRAPAPAPPAIETPGSYVLQAGSFRSHSDADRLQASLALLGVESRIQRVTVGDDIYHRVRVGPIDDLEQLNRTRAVLQGAGVDALTLKVAE